MSLLVAPAPELDGVTVDGIQVELVYSNRSKAFCIGKRGQHHDSARLGFLSSRGVWDIYSVSPLYGERNNAIAHSLRFAANEKPIPYDEIDQSEDDNPENYPLFTGEVP